MKKKITRKIIKAEAWANLAGNWLKTFLLFAIEIFITMAVMNFLPIKMPGLMELQTVQSDEQMLHLLIPGGITRRFLLLCGVVVLLYVFVMSPLSIGKCRFFLKVGRGEKALLRDAFYPFTSLKYIFSSIGLEIIIFVFTVLWEIVLMIVPFSVVVVAILLESELLLSAAATLIFAAAFGAILITSRYNFAKYILADNEERGAIKSMGDCIKIMKTASGECIKLRFSYIVYDILSSYMVPVAFVYQAIFSTVYGKYLYYLRGEKTYLVEVSDTEEL